MPIVEELFWRAFALRIFIDWHRFEDVPLAKFTLLSFVATFAAFGRSASAAVGSGDPLLDGVQCAVLLEEEPRLLHGHAWCDKPGAVRVRVLRAGLAVLVKAGVPCRADDSGIIAAAGHDQFDVTLHFLLLVCEPRAHDFRQHRAMLDHPPPPRQIQRGSQASIIEAEYLQEPAGSRIEHAHRGGFPPFVGLAQ